MSKRYPVLDSNESEILDATVDTTYSTKTLSNSNMDKNLQTAILSLSCYDANGDLVTPGAGTFYINGRPAKAKQFLEPGSGDATIDATKVINGTATYSLPVLLGKCLEVTVTTSGITLATTFKAEVEKYN